MAVKKLSKSEYKYRQKLISLCHLKKEEQKGLDLWVEQTIAENPYSTPYKALFKTFLTPIKDFNKYFGNSQINGDTVNELMNTVDKLIDYKKAEEIKNKEV